MPVSPRVYKASSPVYLLHHLACTGDQRRRERVAMCSVPVPKRPTHSSMCLCFVQSPSTKSASRQAICVCCILVSKKSFLFWNGPKPVISITGSSFGVLYRLKVLTGRVHGGLRQSSRAQAVQDQVLRTSCALPPLEIQPTCCHARWREVVRVFK